MSLILGSFVFIQVTGVSWTMGLLLYLRSLWSWSKVHFPPFSKEEERKKKEWQFYSVDFSQLSCNNLVACRGDMRQTLARKLKWHDQQALNRNQLEVSWKCYKCTVYWKSQYYSFSLHFEVIIVIIWGYVCKMNCYQHFLQWFQSSYYFHLPTQASTEDLYIWFDLA